MIATSISGRDGPVSRSRAATDPDPGRLRKEPASRPVGSSGALVTPACEGRSEIVRRYDHDPLDTKDRDKLRSTQFAYVDSDGGEHLPINDASHVRNAIARFNQTGFESKAAKERARKKVLSAAKRFDIEVDEDSTDREADQVAPRSVDQARAARRSQDRLKSSAAAAPTALAPGGAYGEREADVGLPSARLCSALRR